MASLIYPSVIEPFQFKLKEMPAVDFFKQFQNALIIEQDEIETSKELSITSYEMEDCVTLFGLKRNLRKIESIFAYQIGASTEEFEILDKLEGEGAHGEYDFCLIDAYANARSSGLLDTIDIALIKYFQNKEIVISGITNLNAGSYERFISANLQMNGQLTFCRHSQLFKKDNYY